MAARSKGGHVRGLTVNLVAGLVSVGNLTLTLVNGVAMGISCVVTTNPIGVGGSIWVFQSVNGTDYARVVSVEASFTSKANVQYGTVRASAQVIRCYVEWRDAQGELLARSVIAQGTVP